MSMSDPIADMLTRVRNASNAKLPTVSMSHSKIKAALAKTLKDTGFIQDFPLTRNHPALHYELSVADYGINTI